MSDYFYTDPDDNNTFWDMGIDDEDTQPIGLQCPKCGSPHIEWRGGDNIMNVGQGWSRVDYYRCDVCGHDFTETF